MKKKLFFAVVSMISFSVYSMKKTVRREISTIPKMTLVRLNELSNIIPEAKELEKILVNSSLLGKGNTIPQLFEGLVGDIKNGREGAGDSFIAFCKKFYIPYSVKKIEEDIAGDETISSEIKKSTKRHAKLLFVHEKNQIQWLARRLLCSPRNRESEEIGDEARPLEVERIESESIFFCADDVVDSHFLSVSSQSEESEASETESSSSSEEPLESPIAIKRKNSKSFFEYVGNKLKSFCRKFGKATKMSDFKDMLL